jgi:hypothetical protein
VHGPIPHRSYQLPGNNALLLSELDEAMVPGTEDHLGFGVEPDELERLAAGCRQLADRDQRVELRYLEEGGPMTETVDGVVVRTFFVRYLVPVWFQFHWRSAAPAS